MTDPSQSHAEQAPDHHAACRTVVEPLLDDLLTRARGGGWPREIVFDVLRDLLREKAQQEDPHDDLPVVGDFPLE